MAVEPNPPRNRAFPSYAREYFESAKVLKEKTPSYSDWDGHPVLCSSGFPCAFLYRHAFELMLKAIVLTNDLDEPGKSWVKRVVREQGHGFSKYLTKIKPLAKLLKVDIEAIEWATVERALNELQNPDDSSMEFRYPIDKDANFFKLATGEAFDLEALAEVLEPAFEVLSDLQRELHSAVCELGAERDGILEMIRELEREYSI